MTTINKIFICLHFEKIGENRNLLKKTGTEHPIFNFLTVSTVGVLTLDFTSTTYTDVDVNKKLRLDNIENTALKSLFYFIPGVTHLVSRAHIT